MARYNQLQGPPANLALTATAQTIGGLSVNRNFDGGPILLIAQVNFQNADANPDYHYVGFTLDGVAVLQDRYGWIPAALFAGLTVITIITPPQGPHTITVTARNTGAAPNSIVLAAVNRITLIQLPIWDDPANATI